MKRERAWYTGLFCRFCGFRVIQKEDGIYVQPVDAQGRPLEPYAVHARCRELAR